MKTGQMISVFRTLLTVLIAFGCLLTIAAWADQPSTATSLVQANEEKARLHYIAGDAALKSGDLLTAVVEWENALRLKPSSAYTAKVLAAAAIKLGADGNEAYAHLVNATDLEYQGKLDDAGKELAFALAYHPNDLTPQCLTAKALELADLQKASKPAVAAKPKPATTTTAAKKTAASTSKPSASTAKKKTAASKPAATKSKPKSTHASAPRVPRPPTYHPPRPRYVSARRTTSRLTYVHGHTVNGHYIPGHYTIKPSRPVALKLPY